MIAKELAQLLQTNEIGTLAQDLFIGTMPATNRNSVTIIPSTPEEADRYTATQYVLIDFWARNQKYEDAHDKLQQIYSFLHRRANYETTNYYVYLTHAISNIDDLDTDEVGDRLLRLTVRAIYRNKAFVS